MKYTNLILWTACIAFSSSGSLCAAAGAGAILPEEANIEPRMARQLPIDPLFFSLAREPRAAVRVELDAASKKFVADLCRKIAEDHIARNANLALEKSVAGVKRGLVLPMQRKN